MSRDFIISATDTITERLLVLRLLSDAAQDNIESLEIFGNWPRVYKTGRAGISGKTGYPLRTLGVLGFSLEYNRTIHNIPEGCEYT